MEKRLRALSHLGPIALRLNDHTGDWELELNFWGRTRTWTSGRDLNEAIQRMEARVKQTLWKPVRKEKSE